MRILVAEDSTTMRKVLEMTFAGEGVELLAVENAEQALKQGKQFGPNVAFVDVSLPDIDGYELARAIKADSVLSGTPVVLMASQQNPYDESKGSEAGVDAHILKPFDSQDAIDTARRLTGEVVPAVSDKPPVHATASAQGAPPPLPRKAPSMPVATGAVSSRAPASTPTHSGSSSPKPAIPTAPPPVRSVAPRIGNGMAAIGERLAALGLTQPQIDGVLKLSAEVIERVVWEVVPDLAETMIREELQRLLSE